MADGWHKEMSLHYHYISIEDFYKQSLIQANKLTNKLDPNWQ